jgi:single-strand DNA-binding protein
VSDDWKEEPCYVDIAAFGRQAENCSEYLNKGSLVLVEGRLSYRKWETEDGQTRSKLEVVASNVQFMPKSMGASGPPSGQQGRQPKDESTDVPF